MVDLWLAGDIDRIVEYNQIDAINTYLVWLRVVHFCGKLTSDEYHTEQFAFRVFLEEEAARPVGGHVGKFLERWTL